MNNFIKRIVIDRILQQPMACFMLICYVAIVIWSYLSNVLCSLSFYCCFNDCLFLHRYFIPGDKESSLLILPWPVKSWCDFSAVFYYFLSWTVPAQTVPVVVLMNPLCKQNQMNGAIFILWAICYMYIYIYYMWFWLSFYMFTSLSYITLSRTSLVRYMFTSLSCIS